MIGRSNLGRIVALLAVVALLGSAFALSGCGGTKESPGGPKNVEEGAVMEAAVKAEIIKAMDDAGLKYTKDYVAIRVVDENTAVVTAGTIRKGDKELEEVTVIKGADGKWTAKTE